MSEKIVKPVQEKKVTFNVWAWFAANKRALWTLAALILILLVNRLISPTFFTVRYQDGRLLGSIIEILNRGAAVMLLTTGMTLVIATKGIDLSVGAVIAICGAVSATLIADQPPAVAILFGLGAALLCGVWNGVLVAVFNIQPIVATLILMVVGRGIAQMITNGQIAIFNDPTLSFIGAGVVFGLPFPIFLSIGVLIVVWLFVRRTAVGLLIESVGANDRASFYAGINATMIKLMVYTISGLCAGIAGLILTGYIKGADANNAGLWTELDAILAVVIGGTSLNGGRFNLGLSMIGALIIQSLYTGILISGLPVEFNLVVKAIVILFILLLQSDSFRQIVLQPFRRKTA
ncbi:MAG TPA: ABC transporter permease [Phototrophicaceae bacterium]|nr:ABC transporter permease [Phototrophicaceae bacterium]